MEKQLFIPERIKVGFHSREDTYTKKLAYVIYFDQKGVLRKEKSWTEWCSRSREKIPPVEYPNVPTEGFVLNKGVGGARRSYGWNVRNEYIRVYDPRDFEFEISIANLLFILRECDCSRGKGLEGKFVYAWDGTELVLLPEVSEEYKASAKYTNLQAQTVSAKELIAGASYTTKKQETLTYLGRFDYFSIAGDAYKAKKSARCKKHIFWDGKHFVDLSDLKSIAMLQSDVVTPEFAELVDKFYKSIHGSKVVKLILKDARKKDKKSNYRDEWFYEQDGFFYKCSTEQYSGKIENSSVSQKIYLKDDGLFCDNYYAVMYPRNVKPSYGYHGGYGYGQRQEIINWVEPTGKHLWALLESGKEFRFGYAELIEPVKKGEKNGEGEDDEDDEDEEY